MHKRTEQELFNCIKEQEEFFRDYWSYYRKKHKYQYDTVEYNKHLSILKNAQINLNQLRLRNYNK